MVPCIVAHTCNPSTWKLSLEDECELEDLLGSTGCFTPAASKANEWVYIYIYFNFRSLWLLKLFDNALSHVEIHGEIIILFVNISSPSTIHQYCTCQLTSVWVLIKRVVIKIFTQKSFWKDNNTEYKEKEVPHFKS